jgi:CheY-like chemotaxis protein
MLVEYTALAMARIAIIEDAPDNAEFLRIVVEAGGHLVECFGSGSDFFATTRPKTFDLILLDISMPGLDGYETLQEVRKSDPDIPIVAVTAHAFPSEIQKGLDAGFSRMVKKLVGRAEMPEQSSWFQACS